MSDLTYKSAGVDLERYQEAMQRLPGLLARTHASQGARVMPLPGGFAGLFRLNDKSRQYRDPVLVSGTDGVGTKLKVAIMARKYDTVGIDLVAMCVNDCLCLGAEPLFFLDYIAVEKDDPEFVAALVEGVSQGCLQAGIALLGGETAVMPDLYAKGDFDMAGFCVAVVERDEIIDGHAISPGDVVLGLASSGLHSNGYSLIRKVVFEKAGLDVGETIPDLGITVAEALLEPTRIYADALRGLLADPQMQAAIHGMAHITGGGLCENIERVIPETANCRVQIHAGSWSVPPVFDWLQKLGPIEADEMARVFNMGIGYAMIVEAAAVEGMRTQLSNKHSLESWVIGKVVDGPRGVEFVV